MRDTSRKTPKDTTDFEREQLRFFLAKSDVAAMLAEVNPSLAWLPLLAELKLIDAETQLAHWTQKNFGDVEAIREVAANIHFFGPDTANILEFRLNQAEGLPPLLMSCWRLIIRHMQTANRGALRDGWFDIEPRIKRGEQSSEVLERLANVLRPKLRIAKPFSWHDDEGDRKQERPTDLISIDFEIADGVTDKEVLSVWPENAPADVDDKLLRLLTQALSAALEEAIEAGVEGSSGYGLSDIDVPSVAKHKQNTYRTGFQSIVRVTADLWTRLARKDTQRALAFVELWRASPFRLIRRLALFAVADADVPADKAAHVLMTLPAGELFLTNSSVEVYRLIDTKWRGFSPDEQRAIERRFAEGPPANWFREDSEEGVDRCRFDLLGHLDRSGVQPGNDARAMFEDIRKRWPHWELRPVERAGFHIWHEDAHHIVGDAAKLNNVPDAQLISAARRTNDEADLRERDTWQALCQSDAPRALRGLKAEADAGQWPAWAWHPFMWAAQKLQDAESVKLVAQLLLDWPQASFSEIAADASWWLNEVTKTLDENLLWPLWDRIADSVLCGVEEAHDEDTVFASLNHPSGRLAEVLLKKLTKGPDGQELPEPLRVRLNKLVTAKGNCGRLARVRLAAQVSFLFERAPEWTNEKIIPLFDWSSPDAAAAWSARKYANYIGSPRLFGATKQPFLKLFARAEVPDEDLRTFADWLTLIMIANQTNKADYPLTPAEVRSALRQAGVKSLSSVGHRLAIEMEHAIADEKVSRWRNVIGPVFQSIWPLDIELQTSASTFKLVQILLATGTVFPEAAEVIIPFIRPEDAQHHTSVYSISKADDILYSSSPEKMLDLVMAVVGGAPARSTYGLRKALERIHVHAPNISNTKKYQKLLGLTSNG
jgi:hypothetical protein